jgi:hypothetical protein
MKENKAKKEVECPFCKSWKKIQGIHRYIVSCPENKTETKIPGKTTSKKIAIKRRRRRRGKLSIARHNNAILYPKTIYFCLKAFL